MRYNSGMGRIATLCTDLLFTSKIRETARVLGHEVVPARDPAGFAQAATGAHAAIVDLRLPTAIDALTTLRAGGAEVPVIGFCDHERVDLMERARAAGCTIVLAKGKFSTDLKHLLAGGG